jgi:hypothetical protein
VEDIDDTAGNVQYAFFMFAVMWWANLVFLVSVAGYDYLFSLRFRAIQSVKGLITNDLKFARIIIPMTIRLHVWMIPWAAPPILERRHFEGERHGETISSYIEERPL